MLQQVGKINPNGRQLYRAPASICNACPVKVQCTTSTQGRRVYRHVGEEYVERVRTYQQTPARPGKRSANAKCGWNRCLRKPKIGMVCAASACGCTGRVNCEALRIATGQNLKRLLKKRGWGRRPFPVEALSAFFLACNWWFIHPSLGSVSASSRLRSSSIVNKRHFLLSY